MVFWLTQVVLGSSNIEQRFTDSELLMDVCRDYHKALLLSHI